MNNYIKASSIFYNSVNSKIFWRMVTVILFTFISVSSFAQTTQIKREAQEMLTDDITKTKNEVAMVYLNSASLAQLITLKGIGPQKAQAIMVYREELGVFKSVNQITDLKGIGEKILNDNKSRLRLQRKYPPHL